MWKRRIVYIMLLLAALFMYIATNERLMLVVGILLILLPVASGLVLLLSSRKVHIDCELQDSCVIYQRIGVNIRLTYEGMLPIGRTRLRVEYDNTLFDQTEVQLIFLERGKTESLYYELPYVSQDCGHMEMRFSKAVCFDIMGLFTKRCGNETTQQFTVFPQISEMEIELKYHPESTTGGEQYNQNRKGGDVTEVFDMRDYQDGDSPKSIHWKLSSKLDRLIVREFSHPSNYYTLVLYDTAYGFENESYHKIVNGVLGMTASISRGLVHQNHVHHVGCMRHGEFVKSIVEDNPSYMQMLANMMSTEIADENENTASEFVNRELQNSYTKIVLVTGQYDGLEMQRLSDYVDLSVIYIADVETDQMEHAAGYDLITLAVDSIATKVQMLDI